MGLLQGYGGLASGAGNREVYHFILLRCLWLSL